MIEGVDISSWQGQDIGWPAVAQAGKRFAIIRSGDGWYLDWLYERNLRGASEAGLHVEVYHYLRFAIPPSQMAELCTRRFEIAQNNGAKRLWLDWEDTSAHSKGMPPLQRKAWLVVFLEALGDVPQGHYTGTWWWNPYMDSWDGLKDEKMWIGQYPLMNSCRSDPTAAGLAPTLPDSWTNWLIWQYTSQGTCPGIEGPVDLNVAQDALLEGDDMGAVEDVARHLGEDPESFKARWGELFTREELMQAVYPVLFDPHTKAGWTRLKEVAAFFEEGLE